MPMAINGMDAVITKFTKLEGNVDKAAKAALKAGSEIVVDRLKEAAPVYSGPHKDVTPGALRDSIKAGSVKHSTTDGYTVTVRPEGEDHGQNLAKIGNILQYGRSNMPARPWFHETVAAAESEIIGAITESFTKEMGIGK